MDSLRMEEHVKQDQQMWRAVTTHPRWESVDIKQE